MLLLFLSSMPLMLDDCHILDLVMDLPCLSRLLLTWNGLDPSSLLTSTRNYLCGIFVDDEDVD